MFLLQSKRPFAFGVAQQLQCLLRAADKSSSKIVPRSQWDGRGRDSNQSRGRNYTQSKPANSFCAAEEEEEEEVVVKEQQGITLGEEVDRLAHPTDTQHEVDPLQQAESQQANKLCSASHKTLSGAREQRVWLEGGVARHTHGATTDRGR